MKKTMTKIPRFTLLIPQLCMMKPKKRKRRKLKKMIRGGRGARKKGTIMKMMKITVKIMKTKDIVTDTMMMTISVVVPLADPKDIIAAAVPINIAQKLIV